MMRVDDNGIVREMTPEEEREYLREREEVENNGGE